MMKLDAMGTSEACLVEWMPRSTWETLSSNSKTSQSKQTTYSASGLLLTGPRHSYVITHGSLLLQYFMDKKHFKTLIEAGLLTRDIFSDSRVLVTVERKLKNVDQTANYRFQNTSSAIRSEPTEVFGSIECLWKAEGFADAVTSFLPGSEGWKFYEDPDISSDSRGNDSEKIDPRIVSALLPFFVLIKLDEQTTPTNILASPGPINKGEVVHVVGTPFAAMSPGVFMNSVSQGIVCNNVGEGGKLIITDARCIPGTEGSPLYRGPASSKPRGELIGIIAAPLCWKSNEWIGMSLACSLTEIRNTLANVALDANISSPLRDACIIENLVDSVDGYCIATKEPCVPVAMVRCQGSWGTGVIIDQEAGLLLTCGHVVKSNQSVSVRVCGKWYTGDVVYSAGENQVYDVALVELHGYTPSPTWPNTVRIARNIQSGSECMMVGHAVFGEQHNLEVTLTSGVISKVIGPPSSPVMIQSTCTVNAGASGGPLVLADGSVCGIVSCNAKDTVTGASFPNINLAVPLATVWPSIETYTNTGDKSVLLELKNRDQQVANLWNMKNGERTLDAIRSKL